MSNLPVIPFFYFTVSDNKGNYKLPVRGNATYNIYSWLTKIKRYEIEVTPLSPIPGESINPGEKKEVNLEWP